MDPLQFCYTKYNIFQNVSINFWENIGDVGGNKGDSVDWVDLLALRLGSDNGEPLTVKDETAKVTISLSKTA